MYVGKERKRIVVKIGSSSLTSFQGEISLKKLENLVNQIVKLKDEGHEVILVSSGAVAAGYRKLGFMERPNTLPEKQASAAIGQGLLMESYSALFLSHGYIASQLLITRSDFSDETRYQNVRNTMNVLLDRGIIPIINENDTVTINRLKFGDNDTLSAKVAGLIDADFLAILSDIDGLYEENPNLNPNAKRITQVNEITAEIEAAAGDAGSSVGTGGMKSKLDAFKISMASGIHGFLGKADTPNILEKAVSGTDDGTYFTTDENLAPLNYKKQWIAFHSGPKGELVIHEESQEYLLHRQKSLDHEGILHVRGSFEKGDVVRILDQNEREIGLGIVNYSASKLAQPQEDALDSVVHVVDPESFVCHLELSIPVC
ncbi:glutamate 5-kinase [Bacillus sp. NPDC077027]|uniref:glutamate 5-kinase n=1 Tax=Bacillus sp. NPDC077027 TaxID=3390548 RepID=UPI003D07BD43